MTPENLTESNFQEFLEKNRSHIFVYTTEDFQHPQYFPVAKRLTGKTKVSAKFVRQMG